MTRQVLRYRAAGSIALISAVASLLSVTSSAASEDAKSADSASVEAPLVESESEAGKRLRASGRLSAASACTATVIAPSTDVNARDKALILTAGHCVNSSMGTNEVVVDKVAPTGWSFTPSYFKDNKDLHSKNRVESIVYATMKDADIAVLRLESTYADLAKRGIAPRGISGEYPKVAESVEVGHAPSDGIPADEQYMRVSECVIQRDDIALTEGAWLWRDAVAADCAGVHGGSSGSPVGKAGGPVTAVLNTIATPGFLGCGLNRPCEGRPNGLWVPSDGTSYATPVGTLAACLRPTGVDFSRPGCNLDRGEHLDLSFRASTIKSMNESGPNRWNVTAGAGMSHYTWASFKEGKLGVVNCSNPHGYSRPTKLEGSNIRFNGPLPKEDGLHVVCSIGGSGPDLSDTSWSASLSNPAYAYAKVDNTPPVASPVIDVMEFESDQGPAFSVSPGLALWEIVSMDYKYGPKGTVDCSDRSGYQGYIGFPAVMNKNEGSFTYCAIGSDYAGNETKPAEFAVS
ncbi:trypsin-like peptidase domain-containing protein [Streptomyces sp. NPDC098789]|uniref:trypsin-like peptidase domain-containing protein n=1 Tax=Streptomyces sp. NPDC098789 TaxID=3366098 RepID=UPI0037F2C816